MILMAYVFKYVRSHTGAVSDIISYIVGDGGWVPGIILVPMALQFSYQVRTDVSGLGKDAAP